MVYTPPRGIEIINQKLDNLLNYINDDQLEYQIVDRASFVETPRQRNAREENKHIKETRIAPKKWKEKPHKLCQKDIDARWTKKNNSTHDYLRCYFVVTSNGRIAYRKTRGAREVQDTGTGRTFIWLCGKQHE